MISVTMLEYGSKATSVITIAVGNLSLINLIDLGTMPDKRKKKKIYS
jgi:hypothetical protein